MKSPFRVSKPATSHLPPRRSLSIEKLANAQEEFRPNSQLPSPSPSQPIADVPHVSRKRRHINDNNTLNEEDRKPKRRQVVQQATNHSAVNTHPIAHWVKTSHWPKNFNQDCPNMSLPESNKRKSESSHHSDRQQRLEQNGIHMILSANVKEESKTLCTRLLDGNLRPDQFPCYPADKVVDVLGRVQKLNEARLQRDVTPWVVPSAESLVFSGRLAHEYICEEVQAEWIRCEPMGGSRPRPDFVVGLQRSAFSKDEWARLENYATSGTSFSFTPNLWFPFLVCEVKTDRAGLEAADIQNIHSGSIAVRSILRVCTMAYGRDDQRVKDLLGRVLVFSVAHNHQQVSIYGHYALARDESNDEGENFDYFRYGIAMFSLEMFDGRDRYRAYNFIRNLYAIFVPEHRDRLRDAIGVLDPPGPRTGLSFAASSIGLGEDLDSDQTSSHGGTIFKTPSQPASATAKRELQRMKDQMEKLVQQLEEQRREKERMQNQVEQLMRMLSTVTGQKDSSTN